jgi:Coenzyme PQQ synthesis protein D (PqqD)
VTDDVKRSDTRLRPAPSVHTRMFDGELVILDLAGGEYLALGEIGARLWDGLVAGRSVGDVAREIVADYAVSLETASADLAELASELVRRGLLVES